MSEQHVRQERQAASDPCPSAQRVGRLEAWQHAHAVRCQSCGVVLRFAWWGPGGHECGRCRRRREIGEQPTEGRRAP